MVFSNTAEATPSTMAAAAIAVGALTDDNGGFEGFRAEGGGGGAGGGGGGGGVVSGAAVGVDHEC